MKLIMVIISCLLLTGNVNASEVAAKSDQEWRSWSRVGQAQLTMFFFDIYYSQLLTPSGSYQLESDITPHPLALSITYQRDISQQQLVDATLEQWQKLGYQSAETEQWVTHIENIFPNIKQGNNLTYVTDGKQGQFYFSEPQLNHKLIGVIEDETLNDAFLAIWLSPKTEYPRLRESLIGSKQ